MKKYLLIIIVILTVPFAFSLPRFTDNGNGTITDNASGLIWQKCSAGQSGSDCASGSATQPTWVDALFYCENLSLGGRADWRLPNIKELKSIIDYNGSNPAIDSTYFPGTELAAYWSSTTDVSYELNAWLVDFSKGFVSAGLKSVNYYTRCVSGP